MNKIINKPYLFFWGLIPICLIIGFLLKSSGMNIYYYGGNFVINYWALFVFSSIFFGLIGINYFALNIIKKPNKRGLTIAHLSLQILAIILLFFYIYQTQKENTNFHSDFLNLSLLIAVFIFLIASFIHLINFFLSLISKNDN